MMCAWRYFPDMKGFLAGTSVCGFSLGPLFFSYISQRIVNPDDLVPKASDYGAIKDHFFGPEVYDNVSFFSNS